MDMAARLLTFIMWLPHCHGLQVTSSTRVAIIDAAMMHIDSANCLKLGPMLRAKALSESLLAAAAARDLELSEHLVVEMTSSLAGDDGSMGMWLRGRILLADQFLKAQGLELPGEQLRPHRNALSQSLGTPLHADDPCAGWACAYWSAVVPSDHARLRSTLEAAALHARRAYKRDPSLLSTLLWTHGMNAYAAALASDPTSYEASVGSFADDVGTDSVAAALSLCPADDYPRWLASYLLLAATAADDASLQAELLDTCTGSDASQGVDEMLAASTALLLGVYTKADGTDQRSGGDRAADDLIRKCAPLLPVPAAVDECRVARLKAGNTNTLSRLDVTDGRRFLIREFGTQAALQFDRDEENRVFARLSARRLAPELVALFDGGRIEGWLEGEPCDPAECRTAEVYKRVAIALANLHAFPIDSSSAVEAWGWTAARRWLNGARGCADALESTEVYSPWLARRVRSIDLESIERQLGALHQRLDAMALPLCYCHNDLSNTNVHRNRAAGTVHLIDYEFGGANLRGFDLATHLSHWAGGATDGRYDDDAFPSRQEQRCAALFICRPLSVNSRELARPASAYAWPANSSQALPCRLHLARVPAQTVPRGLCASKRGCERRRARNGGQRRLTASTLRLGPVGVVCASGGDCKGRATPILSHRVRRATVARFRGCFPMMHDGLESRFPAARGRHAGRMNDWILTGRSRKRKQVACGTSTVVFRAS